MEMTIKEHYFEVLEMLADLLVYIFNGLEKRYAKELEVVKAQYPFEDFKCKTPDVKLHFKDGGKMRALFQSIKDQDAAIAIMAGSDGQNLIDPLAGFADANFANPRDPQRRSSLPFIHSPLPSLHPLRHPLLLGL